MSELVKITTCDKTDCERYAESEIPGTDTFEFKLVTLAGNKLCAYCKHFKPFDLYRKRDGE